MQPREAISRLSRHLPGLLPASQQQGADALMRVFELRDGEELRIKGVSREDYLYILKGQASIGCQGGERVELAGGDPKRQRFRMPEDAGLVKIRAVGDALLYQVDGAELDHLIAWREMLNLLGPEEDQARKRAELVRDSRAFHRVPVENLAEALQRLAPVEVQAGDEVVRQGEPGDAYYIIEQGEAEVWEVGLYDDEPKLVNQLGPGEAFGEEALVMGRSRSATVRMVTPGKLLRLGKQDFDELISTELIRCVDPATAKDLVAKGSILLDVRYEEEWEDSSIPECTLIPLQSLRQRYAELDPANSYVAYCRSGARSAVACMLLSQYEYDVVSLSGGIRDWPYEVVSNY